MPSEISSSVQTSGPAAHRHRRLDAIRRGGKRTVAAALSELETGLASRDIAELLDAALVSPQGVCLGLTGPPGVGKSSLIDALIRGCRAQDRSVAVLAVDPSSTRTGGALLGDRTRLTTDPTDAGVFVRSMAARDRLGGVAALTFPAAVLMRALYDLVIIETVGIGQSETDIRDVADIVAFCAQPGSGDALQYMKAGIMEVPDLVLVTKSDLGEIAHRTASDLRGAMSLASNEGTPVNVVPCSASTGLGLDTVLHEICKLADQAPAHAAAARREQAIRWVNEQIRVQFGQHGLDLVHRCGVDNLTNSPFDCGVRAILNLTHAYTEAFSQQVSTE